MNDNEPLAQLLEAPRQTNRLLCRQLTWSRILAVVLAVIAAAAVVLAVRLGGELSRLTEMLNRLNMDSLNSALSQLSRQLTTLDMDGRKSAAGRRQSEPIFRHPEELPPVWLTRAFRPRTKGRVNHAHCC